MSVKADIEEKLTQEDHMDGSKSVEKTQPYIERKENWQVLSTDNHQNYFFNKITKEKTWTKPEILKTEEEKQYSVDWEELTTNDGRTFYYNPKLGKSVWKMPPELKLMREKIQNEKAAGKLGLDFNNSAVDMNFSISITSKLEEQEQDRQLDEKPCLGASAGGSNGGVMPMSREEARRVFISLLKEKGINMSMKWEQVNNMLKNEDRFHIIKTMKEKRQIYQDFISQAKKEERNEARKKLEHSKD